MASGSWRRRGLAFACVWLVLITGYGTAWLIAGGARGAEIATDLGVPLGVFGILAVLAEVAVQRSQGGPARGGQPHGDGAAVVEGVAEPRGTGIGPSSGGGGPERRSGPLRRVGWSGGGAGGRLSGRWGGRLGGRLGARIGGRPARIVLGVLLLALACGLGWVTGHSESTSGTAPTAGHAAARLLKAPDFDGYCRATGQGAAQLAADNAYGWKCTQPTSTGDDAQSVCVWTNGTAQVVNRIADFNNPQSWQCWSATRELGAVDWSAYCRDKGWGQVRDTGKNDVYTWYCTGTDAGLDAQDACLVLYGAPQPVSRFQDYYDKNSWQCWD